MHLKRNFISPFFSLPLVSRTDFFHKRLPNQISSTFHADYALLILMFRLWTRVTNGANQLDAMHLVKAMTLAKIAKFFMIPIVIWSKNASDSSSLRLVLVNGYYFLSLVHVLSILTDCSRKSSTVMTLLTVVVKHIVMVELTHRLRNYVMI